MTGSDFVRFATFVVKSNPRRSETRRHLAVTLTGTFTSPLP
ncbi:MAG: hypothetical protein JWM88_902 [Verrucomicrobia bacterium]|nr:hypothetical protein [Verrucomicrobiota bacterium]